MISDIQLFFKKFTGKASFAQNFAFILSGKVLVSVISFLLTPILARIYTPSDYGQFAIYNLVCNNFVLISTFSISDALLVCKEDEKRSIFNTSILVFCFTSMILVLSIKPISSLLGANNNAIPYILLGAITSGWVGIISKFNFLNNNFRLQSILNSSSAFISRGSAILLGYKFSLPNGLIYGEVISRFFSATVHTLFYIQSLYLFVKKIELARLKRVLIEYRNYPLLIFPSRYIALFNGQIILIVLTVQYDDSVLGQYSMCMGLLHIPINMVGLSIEAPLMKSLSGLSKYEISQKVLRLLRLILYSILFPIVVLTFTGGLIMTTFLGEEWKQSGEFVSIMSPSWMFILIVMVLNSIPRVLRKEMLLFKNNLTLLVGIGIVLLISFSFTDVAIVVWLYSFIYFVLLVYNSIRMLNLINYRVEFKDGVIIGIIFSIIIYNGLKIIL